MTVILSRTIDALDNWCLRRILNIHWSEFVINDEIGLRSRTGQPFLSDTVLSRRLSFIGHVYRVDPWQDHHRALQACYPPENWRRRIGRPRQSSWLRTVEADLRPMNLGLATAKRRAQDRSAWRKLVGTAIRRLRHAPEEEEVCSPIPSILSLLSAPPINASISFSCGFVISLSLITLGHL